MRYLILRDIVNTLRCYTESILFTCKAVCKGGFVNNSIISEIILSTDRNFNAIVCLIIIVNIIFSGYFKYYFIYDNFFFTVRSPCHAVLPDPKIILICSLFSQISMFEDFFADQILPGNLSKSRGWIVICIKEYFNAVGLL